MKFAFVICSIFALFSLSLGLGEGICCQPAQYIGPCMGFYYKWSYIPYLNECKEFVYGGCEGNANNFPSQEVCELMCLRH